MSEEEWRDIPGWEEFYQASDLGRIKSLARVVQRGPVSYSVSERILRPYLMGGSHKSQYKTVALSRAGKLKTRTVHRLVLEAFVGPAPEGMQGCHNNGDSLDNRIENLRWDTRSGNEQDKIEHGTGNRGIGNGRAILTESQILEIRARAGSVSHVGLAKEFGVHSTTIGQIISRKRWKFV